MATFHPQKQTMLIFIVCLLAVVATAIYAFGNTSTKQKQKDQEAPLISTETQNNKNTTTSTSTDWQKSFLQGNPSNNVLKSTPTSDKTIKTEENLTATQLFGRDLFTQYINLKQIGLNNDSSVVSSTIASLLAQDYSGQDKPKTYTTGDIKTNRNNDITALRQYGNSIGTLIKTYAPTQEDASLALEGMQKKNPKYVEELAGNEKKYRAILAGLLKIPVPTDLATYHIGLINGISNMIYVNISFQKQETDPMQAINALETYETAYGLITQNILSIKMALASANITYNDFEGGSIFNQ
jgi:hypothetical protein